MGRSAKFGWLVSGPVFKIACTLPCTRSTTVTLPTCLCGTHNCLPSGEIARSEEKLSAKPVTLPTTSWVATFTMVISGKLMWLT